MTFIVSLSCEHPTEPPVGLPLVGVTEEDELDWDESFSISRDGRLVGGSFSGELIFYGWHDYGRPSERAWQCRAVFENSQLVEPIQYQEPPKAHWDLGDWWVPL